MDDDEQLVAKAIGILVRVATDFADDKDTGLVTYGKLYHELGNIDHITGERVLGKVNDVLRALGVSTMLTSLVIKDAKDANESPMPAGGYFKYAKQHKLMKEGDDEKTFWIMQTNKISSAIEKAYLLPDD